MNSLNDIAAAPVLDLPSASAARDFIEGKPEGTAGRLLMTMLGRSLIIAPALYLTGDRDGALVKKSLAVAVAIETYVLSLMYWQKTQRDSAKVQS